MVTSEREEDAQTAALQEYFDGNKPAGYGASFRAGWDAGRDYERAASERRVAELSEAGDAMVAHLVRSNPNAYPGWAHPAWKCAICDYQADGPDINHAEGCPVGQWQALRRADAGAAGGE